MPRQISRRHFLHTTAATGVAGLSSGWLLGKERQPPASERLAVGVIGITNQGDYDLRNVAGAGAEIVALCDVDERRTGPARNDFSRAKFYTDFRRMIDAGGLDAVVIATPDHTHAVATMTALKAGLHVYCEKPLTHTVAEARLVAETAARHKRVTQMGTQIHAGDNYRRVVEIIQSGAIGPVKEVHVWCGKSWGGKKRPREESPPKGLHYDLWVGPAPYRPYSPDFVPFHWRGWWAFGGGTLADMACHHMDLPFWALKLKHPTHVAAEGPQPDPETAARELTVHYDFPARGELPAVKLTWYDGGRRPAFFAENKQIKWGDGSLFVGSKGMLLADYDRHLLLPREKFAGFQPPPRTIPASIGHHKEWVEACKKGGPTTCSFDYSGALTEAVLLGNVSYRLGKAFDWDARNLKASESGAERFLRTEYRKPWSL
jgi:predicted dehydrogenase